MAAQNNIAKSLSSDAFFSKSSDGNPWSDTFFCARYNRKTTFPFTSKERDRETGFFYFGARYYDSDLSGLFLSVDPMSDKYPSLSPYAYCAWNPIKMVDPEGREALKECGWWKDKKTNEMKWDAEIHSQIELNNKYGNNNGTYKGLTYEKEGMYYSLFGTMEKTNSKQGKFTKKMDEVCMNHATWLDKTMHDPYFCGNEVPVDFSGIEAMSKGGIIPTTGENIREGYSYFNNRAKARVYASKNPQGTWNYSWGDILSPSNQDVNSNLRIASHNGYHLRVVNVALLRFYTRVDAIAFKETFYKIFPNAKP